MQKREQAYLVQRQEVAQGLAALCEQYAGELAFFEMTAAFQLRCEHIPPQSLPSVKTVLEALHSALEAHRGLDSLPTLTWREAKIKRERQAGLETDIADLFARMSALIPLEGAEAPIDLPQPQPEEPRRAETDTAATEPAGDAAPPAERAGAVDLAEDAVSSIDHGLASDSGEASINSPQPVSVDGHPPAPWPEPDEAAPSSDLLADDVSVETDDLLSQEDLVSETGYDDWTSDPELGYERELGGDSNLSAESTLDEIVATSPILLETPQEFWSRVSTSMAPRPALQEAAENACVQWACSDWHSLLLRLLECGDVTAAYWVTRSLAAKGLELLIPDWLLAAVQGSWWLGGARGVLADDLAMIVQEHQPDDSASQRVAAVAAALTPSVFTPQSGLGSWLERYDGLPPAMQSLIMTLNDYSALGQPISRDDVAAIQGQERRMDILNGYTEEAKQWLKEAPNRRSKFKRTNDVWVLWTQRHGVLREIIRPIAEADLEHAEDIAKEVNNRIMDWRRQSTGTHLDQDDIELHGRGLKPIDGTLRARWVNQAELALELAENWVRFVLAGRDDARTTERLRRISDLVGAVRREQSSIDEQLKGFETSGVVSISLARLLRWSFADLCAALQLPVLADGLPLRYLPRYPFHESEGGGLWSGLRFRLLWVPEIDLDDELEPSEPSLVALGDRLYQAIEEGRTAERALEMRIELQDYRFVDLMLPNVSPSHAGPLNQMLQEAISRSKSTFEQMTTRIQDEVEQALADGLINDEERAALLAQVEGTQDQTKQDHYRAALEELRTIHQELENKRGERVRQQIEHWTRIRPALSSLDPSLRDKIIPFMEGVLERRDTIVADERLARIEQILEGGAAPDPAEFEVVVERDKYQEFLTMCGTWESNGLPINLNEIARKLRSGQPIQRSGEQDPWLPIPNLSKSRIAEIADVLECWRRLKEQDLRTENEILSRDLVPLLRYLGLESVGDAQPAVTWRERQRNWAHLSVAMTAGGQSPLPQFGSQHPQGLDVICLWEGLGAGLIGPRLSAMKREISDVIVLYFGKLLRRQRLDILRFAREKNQSLAILDEYLLLYLACEPQARFPVFIECAMPLACANPYSGTGAVPKEMFFDRADETQDLMRPEGACLVYGGRQLGKSALLDQVRRTFHKPDEDRYALYLNIQHVGEVASTQTIASIWRKLSDDLCKLGLIGVASGDGQEEILAHIADMMEKHPSRRILLLLDEADNFLAADSAHNFEYVSHLTNLMDRTQRRFKIIFTGLHNVQRYHWVPNNPLAHLSKPLEIGPLPPKAARELICKPLSVLGWRFPAGDDTGILRILAYTNYHPGLIQLFCRELLRWFYRRRPNNLGPFVVQRSDIEAVYRLKEVQRQIRFRFDWTLALDSRYQALAFSMVLDQMTERDGFARSYRVREMLDLGRQNCPQVFAECTLEQCTGILDDMVGLGVLVRTTDGAYRLRSPNIVRLMGSEEDIFAALQQLAAKAPNPEMIAQSYHVLLDDRATCYGPFTAAQVRALNAERFGVGLVFGSGALCLPEAREAVEKYLVPAKGSVKLVDMSVSSTSSETICQWLNSTMEDHPNVNQIVVFRLPLAYENLEAQVEGALKFCKRHNKAKNRWMRVLFLFDTMPTYEWLRLPLGRRLELEKDADVLWLRRWDETGIRQMLGYHGMLDHDPVITQLMSSTGGWPLLLNELAARLVSVHSDDPLPAVNALAVELENRNTSLHQRFVAGLGLEEIPYAALVYQCVASNEPCPESLVVPAFVGGDLTEDDCRLAVEYLLRMGLVSRAGENLVAEPVARRLFAP